jgi:hypothetical protein
MSIQPAPPKNINLTNGSQMMVCIADSIGEGRNRSGYNLTPGKAYRCYVHDGVMDLSNGGVTEPMEFFASRYWWVESDYKGSCYSSWREYPKQLFVTMEEWREIQLKELGL